MKKETIKESILNPVSMFIIGLLTGFLIKERNFFPINCRIIELQGAILRFSTYLFPSLVSPLVCFCERLSD